MPWKYRSGSFPGPVRRTAKFGPIVARTRTMRRPGHPVTLSRMRVIVVRDGSAILRGADFGQESVRVGDVVLLGSNVRYGVEPEGKVTFTTAYVDTDYLDDWFQGGADGAPVSGTG